MTLPRTCVIGAGPSGIAARRAPRARGVPLDRFEAAGRVGGTRVCGSAERARATGFALPVAPRAEAGAAA
jgi:cation diffusion facilitator CzcD-associated flavoprotein CzcO